MYFDKLTPHFYRWEFTASQTATRLGIVNSPSPDQWLSLEALALTCLEPARERVGSIKVSSGFRSSELNYRVGGALTPPSQHTFGEAADLIPYKTSLTDLLICLYTYADYDQLIWEFGEWVHVSHSLDRPQRKMCFGYKMVNGRKTRHDITREQMGSL